MINYNTWNITTKDIYICVRAFSLRMPCGCIYIDVYIIIMRGASEASFSHTFFAS